MEKRSENMTELGIKLNEACYDYFEIGDDDALIALFKEAKEKNQLPKEYCFRMKKYETYGITVKRAEFLYKEGRRFTCKIAIGVNFITITSTMKKLPKRIADPKVNKIVDSIKLTLGKLESVI